MNVKNANVADVIVVGLGAMGSATTYQLAKRGASVIGIDRFSPPHVLGSTHGDTRITRQAIGEGKAYVPLVLRSHELWRHIENETGADLFTACGGLILTAESACSSVPGRDFFSATVSAAEEYGIEHEVLSTDEIRSRFPQFHLEEEHHCYYEPGAGFVRPEAAVTAQLELAARNGARIKRNERVSQVEATNSGVIVHTDMATYAGSQAVIATGPWISQLAGSKDITQLCGVYRQVLHWFDISRSTVPLTPDQMPVFIWEFGSSSEDAFYGFPAIDGDYGGLKVATQQYQVTTNPDELALEVSAEESRIMFEHCVAGRLPLASSAVRSKRCLYTVTPDHQFIIDQHPEHSNIFLVSPCSGHGFKHSAAIGESLAQWVAEGKSAIDLSAFSLDRFVPTKPYAGF